MEQNTETHPTILIDIIVIKHFLFSLFCTFKLWRLNSRYLDSSFSTNVSKCLDALGYSAKRVKHRIHSFKRISEDWSDKTKKCELIVAGSKAEGVTLPFESDIDVMLNFKNVHCVEDLDCVGAYDEHSTFILMNNSTSPPGYTKLNVLQIDLNNHSEIANSINVLQDGSYLANDAFKKNCSENHFSESPSLGTLHQEISGPALNLQMDGFDNLEQTNQDLVFSLPGKFKSILQSWVNRTRNYGWPSNELVENVKVSGIGYLVPVGIKGSDKEWLEWRICFTTVEISLMQELNDTQRKVYIILKRLSKHIIKSVCANITSYVLKNLVLWLAEMNPQDNFTEEVLTERVLQSIAVLRNCIQIEYLPSYIIPERNLLAGKITAEQKPNLIDCLNNCIEQGDTLIKNLNWPKLKKHLSATVHELQRYEQFRDNVENLILNMAENMESRSVVGESENGESRISRKGILLRFFEHISSEAFSAYLPIAMSILYPNGAPDGDIHRVFLDRVSDILG